MNPEDRFIFLTGAHDSLAETHLASLPVDELRALVAWCEQADEFGRVWMKAAAEVLKRFVEGSLS